MYLIWKLRFIVNWGGLRARSGVGRVQGEPTGDHQPLLGRDSLTRWWVAAYCWLIFIFCQGWCGSADPRKRGTGTKSAEVDNIYFHFKGNIFSFPVSKASELRKEMEEARGRRELEHLELTSGEGLELVPIIKNLTHPLKDPATGYLVNANEMMKDDDPSGELKNVLQ